MEIPEDGCSTVKPCVTENPGGGGQTGKKPLGVWNIFLYHTGLIEKENQRELVHLSSILSIKIVFAY